MPAFDFKKYRTNLFIIIGFAVLALLYSYPQLSGKVLSQGDITHWKAMSKEGKDFYDKTGENVLWSNSMFGGMPTYTYYTPVTSNYIFKIHSTTVSALGGPAVFFFIAMVGCFMLMRALKVNKWLAVVGAVAYAFSSNNPVVIAAGHNSKMYCLGYFPMVLAGLIYIYQSKWWRGIPIMGISLALMVSNGHYQVLYYAFIVVLFAVVGMFVMAVKEKTLKQFFISSFVALVVGIIAMGPGMVGVLPTMEYNKETMRGGKSELTINQHDKDKKSGGLDKEYAFRWSNNIGETFSLMIPFLYGGASGEELSADSKTAETLSGLGVPEEYVEQMRANMPLYWGDQPFIGGPIYFGAVVCFLFVLGIMVVRSQHKWWIVAVCALAIIMSWGRHFPAFNYFLFDTLPMLNKFRVPNMILAIPELLFPVLGMWALNDIFKDKLSTEEVWKKVKLSVIITAGICLVLGLFGSMFFSFKAEQNQTNDKSIAEQYGRMLKNEQAGQQIVDALREDRASIAMKSGLTSAIYIIAAGALIWAYSRKKINAKYAIAGIGLLIVIDLFSVDKRYLNEDNFVEASESESSFQARPVDQQIMKDPDPYYRVLDLSRDPYNDATQAYFHKCVGGYSPAKMERYQDLIDIHMSGKFNAQVLNMLNTKYIIYTPGGQGEPVAMPNPEACGNGWFVNEVKWANTADEEILALNAHTIGDTAAAGEFNPKTTAVMRATFKNELGNYEFGKDSGSVVRLTKYGLNELSFESNNSKNGLAVFADMYYPYGWKAYVDGKETPIMKADYVLRAIKVPAGQHKIEFKFHPKSFYTGNTMAMISSLLLYLMLGVSIFQLVRKKDEEPEEE